MVDNPSEPVRVHAFKPRVIKRHLVKQSRNQLFLPFPLRQLRLDLNSVVQFPLSRGRTKIKKQWPSAGLA